MKHPSYRKPYVKRQWRIVIGTLLILALLSSYAITARREPPISTGPTSLASQEISPASLTPSTPSKEYIRLGGKLVAVEEPAP